MTPEQTAIRQWLSKPAPYFYACGCMGPRPISGQWNTSSPDDFIVVLKSVGKNKIEVIKIVRNNAGISLMESKKLVESAPASIWSSNQMNVERFKKELEAAGATVNRSDPIPMFPYCGCQMQMVEEVGGSFYLIKENRTPDGITHQAFLVGPVGGPYNLSIPE